MFLADFPKGIQNLELDRIKCDGNVKYGHLYSYLKKGDFIEITDTFPTVLQIYTWLKKKLRIKESSTYLSYKSKRALLSQLSSQIFLAVEQGMLKVKKAPTCLWLKEIYGEQSFLISLKDFFSLNASYQNYLSGKSYPFFEHKIFPHFGVYFPNRIEHLELLFEYLPNFKNKLESRVLDLACGSGVVSLMLLESGFQKIQATDINPFAISTIKEAVTRLSLERSLSVTQSDMFESIEGKYDLIIVNPPWLPGEGKNLLMAANEGSSQFLDKFFAELGPYLSDDGDLIVLFSNMAELLELSPNNEVLEYSKTLPDLVLKQYLEKPVEKKRIQYKWQKLLKDKEKVQLWHFKKSVV